MCGTSTLMGSRYFTSFGLSSRPCTESARPNADNSSVNWTRRMGDAPGGRVEGRRAGGRDGHERTPSGAACRGELLLLQELHDLFFEFGDEIADDLGVAEGLAVGVGIGIEILDEVGEFGGKAAEDAEQAPEGVAVAGLLAGFDGVAQPSLA